MRSGAYDAMPALHRFLAGYPRGPSLELGAGAGDFAALVAAARPDPAPYVCLEEYRPELRKARARGLACVSAHPTRPPFAGGFATVFLANILHHSVDPGALLAASRPLLLSSGKMVVVEGLGDGLDGQEANHRDFHHWGGEADGLRGITHRPTYAAAELEALLVGGGLGILHREYLREEKAAPLADGELGRIRAAMEGKLASVPESHRPRMAASAQAILDRIRSRGLRRARHALYLLAWAT